MQISLSALTLMYRPTFTRVYHIRLIVLLYYYYFLNVFTVSTKRRIKLFINRL